MTELADILGALPFQQKLHRRQAYAVARRSARELKSSEQSQVGLETGRAGYRLTTADLLPLVTRCLAQRAGLISARKEIVYNPIACTNCAGLTY